MPGSFMVESARRALLSTTIWISTLPGSPSGCPMGHLRKTALGAPASTVSFLTIDMLTVGIPSASIALWTSPTDRLQVIHPGVRSTAPTESALSPAATSGAVSLTRVSTWRPVMCPMSP